MVTDAVLAVGIVAVTDAVLTGGVVAVSLGAFQAITQLVKYISSKKGSSNGKAPAGFYARMDQLADMHMGPAALDQKTGTPRWWGVDATSVLEEIRDLIQDGGDAKLREEILRFLRAADTASTELAGQYMDSLNAQTDVLTRIAEKYENCEYCNDSKE